MFFPLQNRNELISFYLTLRYWMIRPKKTIISNNLFYYITQVFYTVEEYTVFLLCLRCKMEC
jgi:hypothetical protein